MRVGRPSQSSFNREDYFWLSKHCLIGMLCSLKKLTSIVRPDSTFLRLKSLLNEALHLLFLNHCRLGLGGMETTVVEVECRARFFNGIEGQA